MAEKESPNDHLARHDREISNIRNSVMRPASEQHEGLMQAQDKSDLIHASGIREWLSGKTYDVLKLPQGSYAAQWSSLINTPNKNNEANPDAPIAQIEVRGETDETGLLVRRNIHFFQPGIGAIWYISTHNNTGDYPLLWRRMQGNILLWSGAVDAIGTKIELLDSASNYSSFVFDIRVMSKSIKKPLSIDSTMTIREPNISDSNGTWLAMYELTLSLDSDKRHITITNNHGVLHGDNGSTGPDENRISITRLEGVR